MGSKNNPGKYDCYDKAEPDEPMFVLLARDPRAPELVQRWVAEARISDDPRDAEKLQEALQCAEDMEAWRAKNRP